MDLNEARARLPELAGLSDESALNVIHQVYYPSMEKAALADRLGYKPPPPKIEPRGMLRGVADLGLELASGAVKGTRFMSDAFGAENAVSKGLSTVDDFLKALQSAQAKGEDQRVAQIMAEAEDKGVWDQVKAALSAAGEAPVRQSIGALATGAPIIAASMIPGLREASWGTRLATMGGLGGVQGAGVVKDSIYQGVYERAIQEGRSEQEARELATDAQSYDGQNKGLIAGGSALGVGAMMTGFQPAAVRALSGQAGKASAFGLAGSLGMGVLKEVPLEAAQGGQEQYAANVAQQRAGFDTPTWRGVAGSMTLEGLLSAPGGAAGGAMDYYSGQREQPPEDPNQAKAEAIRQTEAVLGTGPLSSAANVAVETKAQAVEQGAPVVTAAEITRAAQARLDELDAKASGTPDQKVPGPDGKPVTIPGTPAEYLSDAEIAERNELRQNLSDPQALARSYGVELGDESVVQQGARLSEQDLGGMLAPENPLMDGARALQSDREGEARTNATLAQMERQAQRDLHGTRDFDRKPEEEAADQEPDLPFAQEGDVLNPKGEPFKTRMAADRAAKKAPGDVIAVVGGFVVRPAQQAAKELQEQDLQTNAQGAMDGATQVQNDVAAQQLDSTKTAAEPANVQDQPQGTAPAAAAPAPAQAVQAPQAVGSDGVAQPGAAPAGNAGVEAAGVSEPAESEKAKWIKATIDKSRLNGANGVQIAVAPNGGITFLGDPNSSKDGKALLANYEKALAAGATQKEIAEALNATATPTATPVAQPPAPAATPTATPVAQPPAPAATPSSTATEPANAPASLETAQAVETAPQGQQAPAAKPVTPRPANVPPEMAADESPELAARWGAMSAEQRQVAARGAGWSTAKGTVNVVGKAIARKSWADQAPSTRKRLADVMKASAPADAQAVAAPAPVEPQETTHNGTRIYRTRTKLGDEVKTMWAVETPENKARRAAGERTLGGDTLHDTLEQAKAAADREAKQFAERKAFAEQQDADERARKEADEARKAGNRGKSIFERRKEAVLDGQTKLPASAGLGNTTRRDAMQMAVEQRRAVVERQVDDTAAKKRDQDAIDRVRSAGYMLGLSNENIPVVKAGLEAQARLKANDYKKPEYRVYAGSEPTGGFHEITKIEYEYAQELMAQKEAAQAAVPAPEPEPQTEEFLPEGWTKGINGYTKRPVYRMEQGGGLPFAVVTQTEGMTYEVQIRHGDKQLTISTQRGALSEVLPGAKAELAKMTQAASATHQDPGEKPEAATKGVVNDSLKTAAKNEDTKPSEMRKWLLAEIDKELLQAPDRANYDEAVKRLGEKDAISMYTGNGPLGKNTETGFITFDVPGDGKFKVRNSVRGLLEFRKNVNASMGFKDNGQKPAKPDQNDGVQGGSGGQMAAVTNMIEEGDFEAARDFAEAVGIKLEDVKVPRGENAVAWKEFLSTGKVPEQKPVSREWTVTNEQNPNGTWSRVAKLKRKADGAEYEATVTGTLDNTRATYVLTKDGKEYSRLTNGQPFSTAIELAENAMPAANDKPAPSKASDTGWNMAGTGYGGKRYTGRNITLADGREVVARIYENAGNYDEVEIKVDGARKFTVRDSYNAQDKVEIKVDGARKFTVRDSYNAQDKADAFIRTLTVDQPKAEGSPTDFIPAPDGGLDYGEITPEMSKAMRRQAGKIRLRRGDDTQGLIHIEARHLEQFKKRGFSSVQDFVASVAKSFTAIYKREGAALDVVLEDGGRGRLVVQLEMAADGDFYDVKTASPIRVDQFKNRNPLWVRAGTSAPVADGNPPSPEGQSGAASVAQPPEGYKPAGEPFYRDGELTQGYAPFDLGQRVTMKESGGQSGVIDLFTSPDKNGVFDGAMVKFDNGVEQIVKLNKLEAAATPAPQAETPKLTQAEAKGLMEWQDLGQKDGIKTHILTFYESKADKGAKRGRMVVATVTKEADSKTWVVEGTDDRLAMLGMAKKKAEAVGMARAVADGFVEAAAAAPEVPKKGLAGARAKKAAEAEAQRAAYFTPGNIVNGYGGFDRVLEYTPVDERGSWSVRMQAVVKQGEKWVDAPNERPRWHSTQPEAKELAAGPVVRAAVQPAEASAPAPAAQIEDAGQKIGGARKDRWKERGLNLSDLDSMSESEGAELATKANVWKPDWEALAEQSDPVTAATVKVIYDRLAAKPEKNTPDGRRQFVEMMQAVRKVFGGITSAEQLKTAKNDLLFNELKWTEGRAGDDGRAAENAKGIDDLGAHMKAAKSKLFSVYKGRSDPFVLGFNELQRVKKMVADGFPAKAEPWKARLVVGRLQGGPGTTERGFELYIKESAELGTPLTRDQIAAGFYRVMDKKNNVVAFAPTKEDAEAAAKTIYERDMKGGKDSKPEPERPYLDELKREGLPQRIDRDVTSEDFIKDLGFRGIEFGLWAAQDERQRILNMAYDGLMDLAQIMGVPPKAMSLNGTLGMAFGARGGGRFAAHYEPGKLVINMTKLRGSGSMAHEFAHALDHYFGELNKPDAYTTQARGASGWYTEDQYRGVPRKRMEQIEGKWKSVEKMRLDNLRPEMAKAFDDVMLALFQKQMNKAEMVRSSELELERTQASALTEKDPDLKAMYERMAQNQQQALEELRKDPEDTMYANRGRSEFANEAQALSGKATNGYWTRPTEMFARAFESWVFDRVAGMGAKSDYLVHGVEEDRFAGGQYKGNPYPAGEERARINAAFDKLTQTIQTKEDDAGNVAMFSRAQAPAKGIPVQTAQQIVDAIAQRWDNAPAVVVLADMNDPRVPAAVRQRDAAQRSGGAKGDPEGFFYKGTAYVVAGSLKTPGDVVRVLFHESLGHYGLRGVFGDALTPILKQIAALRKTEVQAKADEYGLDMTKESERLQAAEEVLAVMAQTSPDLGYVKRAVAAVRAWLRKTMPKVFGQMKLTDAEIIQQYLLPARRFVERGPGGGPRGGLPAFSLANDDSSGIIRVVKLPGAGTTWVVTRNIPNAGTQHLGYYESEPDAREAAERERTEAKRSAGAGARWWVTNPAEPIQSASLGRLDSLGRARALKATLDARKSGIKSFDEGLALEQIPDRAGFCFKLAAEAAAAGLGDMVIGIAENNGDPVWHAVVRRDGAIYDPTFARWFEPGIYESLGFRAHTTLTGKAVQDYIASSGGFAPDSRRLGLKMDAPGDDAAAFSRSLPEALAQGANNVRDLKLPAGYVVNDFFQTNGKLGWWHKTVGTMYNLAQRSSPFKRVFDTAQEFINDVSYFATEASSLAPNILPRLETIKDILRSPLSAADNKAIAAPIFEGTLIWARDPRNGKRPVKMEELEARAKKLTPQEKAQELLKGQGIDPKVLRMWQGLPEEKYAMLVESRYSSVFLKPGIVFKPAELKELFGLNDRQVGLYQEFRKAADKSLMDLAVTDMLRFAGEDLAPLRDVMLEAKTVGQAASLGREYLLELAQMDEGRQKLLEDTAARLLDKAATAQDLMDRGYAPLSRFGRYSLDVVDQDGERVYFGLFESRAEANKMARQMQANYPGAQVRQGTMSEEEYKLFSGVTPETLELFGEMLGLEAQGDDAASRVFQQYLKLAKTSRSAMKRLIHRKGIAGFSEDPGRVLAGFIYSNARQSSASLHMGTLSDSVAQIPKGQGELKDAAMRLHEYVKTPQEEAQALRGLLFAQYLGGSVASAMVNATQPFAVTVPWLSQYGGAVSAAKQMSAAVKDVLKRSTGDPDLDKALRRAEEDGIVSPQEVFQLQAQAAGRASLKAGDGTLSGGLAAKGSNALSKFSLAWGKLFSVAEQFNRRTSFIAAYRTAVAQGIPNPAKFAETAVYETQFIYCVDQQTECLTTSGWKRRADLVLGDVVIGVDANGKAVETPLVAVHEFPGRHAVTEFSNANRFSMVVTAGHRHVVQNYNSRDKRWQKPIIRTTTELRDGHHLLRVPAASVERGSSDADFAALLGWVAAEGSFARFQNCVTKRNVRLVQSESHNPQYVEEIESLLQRLGGHYRKFKNSRDMVLFTLKKPLSTRVLEAMPDKLLTWDMVASMDAAAMRAMLDAFAKGDGHKMKEGGWSIGQKQEQNLEVLQAMAVLCGQNATLYPAADRENGKVAHLYLHKQTARTMMKQLTKTMRDVDDGVWCPETGTGTWIARRNGAVFVTGNSKANKPQWARGAIGGTVFTFKQYSISYLELMHRMWTQGGPEGKKAALLGIGVLFLLSGAGGLPFAGDVDDLIDGAMQRMGYNFSSKRAKQEFFTSLFGEAGGEFVERGISGLAGVPIDVSGRLGMDNLIPGTGIFLKKENRSRDLLEIVGPAGDFAKRILEGGEKALAGDVVKGAITASPLAMRNVAKAWEMTTTGMYLDTKGRKVLDVDGFDALAKSIGFQPNDVAKVQEATWETQRMVSMNRLREGEIAEKWAKGVFLGDQAMVAEARAALKDWNAKNPDTPIRIDMPQIVRRVRQMRTDKVTRVAQAAPREIRAQARAMLAEGQQ